MDKEYFLGLYEKALPNWYSWQEKFETALRCGFDGIEISIDESDYRLERLNNITEECRVIRRALADSGLQMKTMCLSGHRKYPLGSHDALVRQHALEIMKNAIRFACEIGIRIIQLAGYDVYYEKSDTESKLLFEENLKKCVSFASAEGVVLGFETMETPFMDTVGKAMVFIRKINSPYLGVYPDIGNLQNAALKYGIDVVSDISTGTGHIFAAHLKETKVGVYRDMMFGRGGTTEYERSIHELWKQGVRIYTGEFWYKENNDAVEDISYASRFLREKIRKAISGYISKVD